MSEKQRYETQRMDHHGIVAGICHEIGLVEQIDQIVGRGERKVSCGEAALAMVLNGLGFSSRALYLVSDFLRNKPVDLLINPNLTAEDFNDDTLGRALDDLYEHGVTEVFAGVSARAMQTYGIETDFRHLDSSSLHLHGEYEGTDPETTAITITHGYSRDHRPDLKQVIVQLITMESSRLPVWLEVLSGNNSDKSTFVPSIKAYSNQLSEEEQPYFVMDSAGFSEENLKNLGKTRWLTRVPETLSEAKRLVRETDQRGMEALREGYFGKETLVEYGGIQQRWLVVFSEAAYQRELKTLDRAQARELEKIEKEWRKLKRVTFKCEPDADKACDRFNQRWKYHQVQAQAASLSQYARRGRPAVQDEPEVVGYKVQGEIVVREPLVDEAKKSLGKFIIATNEQDSSRLSAKAMLAHYTAQGVSVERGFRFLKDPMFFADSLFLKKPERIMALVMIMGLSLLIYALAERKLRQALQEKKDSIPDQKGKPTNTPTMRWVFQTFEGIDVLSVRSGDRVILRQMLNLQPVHSQIIRLLGPPVQKCYLENP